MLSQNMAHLLVACQRTNNLHSLFSTKTINCVMKRFPGRIWKVTRRHLSPLFHPHNLNQLMPLMNECGRDLTSILSGHVGPVDVSSPVFAVALKSVHREWFIMK